MTAAAALTRPVLYVVPSGGRDRPAPSRPRAAGPREPLPALTAELAARVIGTLFGPVAGRLAAGLTLRAPLLVRRARPEVWAGAIVYLLAEESQLFAYDCVTTRTSLARELGPTLPTLRRRAADVRAALDPLVLELPEPDLR